jgi:hypothetical protein
LAFKLESSPLALGMTHVARTTDPEQPVAVAQKGSHQL